MKTLVEKINEAVIALAKERVEIEKAGFFYFWQLQNGLNKFTDWDSKRLSEYVESQKSLGYSEDDLSVSAWISTHGVWANYIAATVENKFNGSSYRFSNAIQFLNRDSVTKKQLEEADLPVQKLVLENRSAFLNKKEAAAEFIEKGRFYQNNIERMCFDKETHDYVLSVKNEIENNKKMEIEAARNTLLSWAIENGSDLLKLRIKHNQNWQTITENEWALAHTKGFGLWPYDETNEDWDVNNANINQLMALESSKSENPDCDIDITRSKWVDEFDVTHRTFLRCFVKTPIGTAVLFREIEDADDQDE
jgi:hypothetical protein